MLKNKLKKLLDSAKISLSDEQIDKLIGYVNLLNKWNKAYNLTSVRDPQEMLVKHIIDSLVVAPYLTGSEFIDVGTGPGLPGVPLAIIQPENNFTLVDSLGKRIRFLKQVQFELNLKNIHPIQCRVEEFTDKQFDGVISRAFASLEDMLKWCPHLVKQDGAFYALKGLYPEEEINKLPKNFIVTEAIKLVVPELPADRHLIIIRVN